MSLAGLWRISCPFAVHCMKGLGQAGNIQWYFSEASFGIQVAVALLWYCFEVCIPIFKCKVVCYLSLNTVLITPSIINCLLIVNKCCTLNVCFSKCSSLGRDIVHDIFFNLVLNNLSFNVDECEAPNLQTSLLQQYSAHA